ncbi:uncharacterized protein BDZ99DRAFT_545497 [Mytilinidion resinicola]|uniref:Uncharacterized protein n=1 Tax=Mytilinidion resinicola TaxID=574789 RepID=A0A6A6Y623_9PEZI|nr:uncharacterized protein BDZ99DRAFT_545497 [Mytilinidion resinicola]KAF2804266.1 hypothetical protein BDZ99DRAFT_545497 [Mytilinidion resinicola]
MPFSGQILNIFSSPSKQPKFPQKRQAPKTPQTTQASSSMPTLSTWTPQSPKKPQPTQTDPFLSTPSTNTLDATPSGPAIENAGLQRLVSASLDLTRVETPQVPKTPQPKASLSVSTPSIASLDLTGSEPAINELVLQQPASASLDTPLTGTKRKLTDSISSPRSEKQKIRKFLFQEAKILDIPNKGAFSNAEVNIMVEAIRHNEGVMAKWKEDMIKHVDAHEKAQALRTKVVQCVEKKNKVLEHYIDVELKALREGNKGMREEVVRKNRKLDEAERRIEGLLKELKGKEENVDDGDKGADGEMGDEGYKVTQGDEGEQGEMGDEEEEWESRELDGKPMDVDMGRRESHFGRRI